MLYLYAFTARVGTVVPNVRVGAVLSGSRVDRKSSSPGRNANGLPSTYDCIEEAVPDLLHPALAHGQIVRTGYHHAMTIVECRAAVIAEHASAILREKSVAVRSANAAGCI